MIPSLTIKIPLKIYFQWSFNSNFLYPSGFLKKLFFYICKLVRGDMTIFSGGKSFKECWETKLIIPLLKPMGGTWGGESWGCKSKSTKYIYF